MIIEKFEEVLKNLGIDTYYLSVFTDNSRARKFYEKCGFKVFSENDTEIKYIKNI